VSVTVDESVEVRITARCESCARKIETARRLTADEVRESSYNAAKAALNAARAAVDADMARRGWTDKQCGKCRDT